MQDNHRPVTFSDLKNMEDRLFKGMAEVVQDILKNVVTKPEFEERMAWTEKRFDRIEKKMVSKADISDMVGELQSVREQLTMVLHQYERTQKEVGRIKVKLALA